jgi:hypothetical protein
VWYYARIIKQLKMPLDQSSHIEIINNGVHDGHDCLASKIHSFPIQDIDTNGVRVSVGAYEPHNPAEENAAITASVMGADSGRRAVVITPQAEFDRIKEIIDARKGAERKRVVIINGQEISEDVLRQAILDASQDPDNLGFNLPKPTSPSEAAIVVTIAESSSPDDLAEATARVRNVDSSHPLTLNVGQGYDLELIRQRIAGHLSPANLPFIKVISSS